MNSIVGRICTQLCECSHVFWIVALLYMRVDLFVEFAVSIDRRTSAQTS